MADHLQLLVNSSESNLLKRNRNEKWNSYYKDMKHSNGCVVSTIDDNEHSISILQTKERFLHASVWRRKK